MTFSLAACGDGLPIGDPGPGVDGGNDAGTTDDAGPGSDAGGNDGGAELGCNSADETAIANYSFDDFTADDAVAASGQDCVLNPEEDCAGFAAGAAGGNPAAIENLANCVGACLGQRVGVSATCQDCYGDIVACGASACAFECICRIGPEGCQGPALVACNTCLNANCVPAFNDCSGLDGTLPE